MPEHNVSRVSSDVIRVLLNYSFQLKGRNAIFSHSRLRQFLENLENHIIIYKKE